MHDDEVLFVRTRTKVRHPLSVEDLDDHKRTSEASHCRHLFLCILPVDNPPRPPYFSA